MSDSGFSSKTEHLTLEASATVLPDEKTLWQLKRGFFDRLVLRGELHEPVSDAVTNVAKLAQKHGLPLHSIAPTGSPLDQFVRQLRLLEAA